MESPSKKDCIQEVVGAFHCPDLRFRHASAIDEVEVAVFINQANRDGNNKKQSKEEDMVLKVFNGLGEA